MGRLWGIPIMMTIDDAAQRMNISVSRAQQIYDDSIEVIRPEWEASPNIFHPEILARNTDPAAQRRDCCLTEIKASGELGILQLGRPAWWSSSSGGDSAHDTPMLDGRSTSRRKRGKTPWLIARDTRCPFAARRR
jgi:hypothetical protein